MLLNFERDERIFMCFERNGGVGGQVIFRHYPVKTQNEWMYLNFSLFVTDINVI
jgi:hypothetical protein